MCYGPDETTYIFLIFMKYYVTWAIKLDIFKIVKFTFPQNREILKMSNILAVQRNLKEYNYWHMT